MQTNVRVNATGCGLYMGVAVRCLKISTPVNGCNEHLQIRLSLASQERVVRFDYQNIEFRLRYHCFEF